MSRFGDQGESVRRRALNVERRTSNVRHQARLTALFYTSLLALSSIARAQDVQVRATASTDTIGLQEQFQLTITISGTDSGEAELPRVRFPDFQVVSGPNVSTQFEWINGRSSSSKSVSYVLIPRKEGTFTIEPVAVTVRGKTVSTEPVRIRVVTGATGATGQQPSPPRSQPLDPFGLDRKPSGTRVASTDVFVAAEMDRSSAYPGQQVTLSYHLYTRVGVSGLQLQESPPLNGFWVEDLQVESNPPGNRKTVDGAEYLEYLVKKQALFPTTTGRIGLPPATFAISVKTPGDFFGFFSGNETVYRKSKEIFLEVKPLPQDRPQGYGNAVGAFNLTSSLDKTNAATGEAVSLRIKLEGRGNLKMIPDIALPPLPEFTVFSAKRVENVRPFESDVIGGDKTWEYVIVPKAPGQQSIPAMSFSYFDPLKDKYETLTTPPLALNVVRGADSAASALSGVVKQDLTRQGADINFIKLSAGDLRPRQKPLYESVWFFVIAGIPVASNIAVLLYQRERSKQSFAPALTRSRKARRLALARLKQALRAGRREPKLFYDQAAVAFSGYLADRFRLPEIAVTGDTLEKRLSEKFVPLETIHETISCLQECDFGRFVSASTSAEKLRALAGRMTKTIDLLERAN